MGVVNTTMAAEDMRRIMDRKNMMTDGAVTGVREGGEDEEGEVKDKRKGNGEGGTATATVEEWCTEEGDQMRTNGMSIP
eukprot:gene19125-6430_t